MSYSLRLANKARRIAGLTRNEGLQTLMNTKNRLYKPLVVAAARTSRNKVALPEGEAVSSWVLQRPEEAY